MTDAITFFDNLVLQFKDIIDNVFVPLFAPIAGVGAGVLLVIVIIWAVTRSTGRVL